jgi:predicted sulfurtransferase
MATKDLPILNIAAYKFIRLPEERLKQLRQGLADACERADIKGTILLSPQGLNLFLAGLEENVFQFWRFLTSQSEFRDLIYKASFSAQIPFKRLRVKIKNAIIPLSADVPDRGQEDSYVSPKVLKCWLDEDHDVTLVDVRNDYEVHLGKFETAQQLGIDDFRTFPEAIDRLEATAKDQAILLYCTGGIRCEKAVPLMRQQGFNRVYQLEGGILNYFEECGNAHFQGECFVFDERVGLDSRLRETETILCENCQYPVSPQQQRLATYRAGESCPHCAASETSAPLNNEG